jgi:hypothetical protein
MGLSPPPSPPIPTSPSLHRCFAFALNFRAEAVLEFPVPDPGGARMGGISRRRRKLLAGVAGGLEMPARDRFVQDDRHGGPELR